MDRARFVIHENRNQEFGPVAIWDILIPEHALTHNEELRVYARSSTQPGFYRELFVQSYSVGRPPGHGRLLFVVDPDDAEPSLRKLTVFGSWIVFRDELYSYPPSRHEVGNVIELSLKHLRPLTQEQIDYYLQLFPR